MKRVLIGFLIAGIVYLWWTGLLAELSDADRIRSWLDQAGPFGPLLFFLVVFALLPIFLAGPPIWLSSSVWPLPLALFYSLVAGILAGIPFFLLVRRWGRNWAQGRIPERVRRWEERLEAHPISTVMILRLLLWINPAVDLLVGISKVSLRDYLIGTVVGLIPPTIFQVVVGAKGIEWAQRAPGWVWFVLGSLVAVILLIRAIRRRSGTDPGALET